MLLIHCPACHGALEVDAAQLTRPRRICCTICSHRWVEDARGAPASRAAPDPAPVTPALVEQAIPFEPPLPSEPKRAERRFGRKRQTLAVAPAPQRRSPIGLTGTFALLVIFTLLIAGRETVVQKWPPSAQAYALLRLPVNLHGLELHDMRTRILQEPTQRVLTIDGQIRNLRDNSQALPELQLSLRDKHGREVYAWKAPPPKSGIARGETIQFRARLASPPDGADVVRVQFAEPAPTRTASR